MLYRLKKAVRVRKYNGGGYIVNMDTHADLTVDESGAVFLFALTPKAQTLEQLCDTLLKTFIGVGREVVLNDAREFYDSLVVQNFLVSGEKETDLDAKDVSLEYDAVYKNSASRDTINFYIPGFDLKFLNFYRSMIVYMREFPYRFMENIHIPAVYGSFNNMIWNGGRRRIGKQATYDEMQNAIQAVNNMGIAVRYTYTNSAIEEKHLGDTLCNLSMKLANNGKNEVLVNSPILENYLRKNYPNFKYILSTTACERDVNKINEATKKYDLVVIDWRDNKNMAFLDRIKDKDKIEILIDEKCPSGCKMRKMDYDLVSKKNCYIMAESEIQNFECLRTKADVAGFYRSLKNNPDTDLTFDEVYGLYYNMGFRNFKLLGRNEKDYLSELESYIYYMAVPESRDVARYDLLGIYMDYVISSYGGDRNTALKWYEERLGEKSFKGEI